MSSKAHPGIDRVLELFTDHNEGQCHQLLLPAGEIVAYTRRAPYKDDTSPNEDRMAVLQIDRDNVVFVVADGVGGSPAGADAAATVVEKLAAGLEPSQAPDTVQAQLISALEDAHEEVRGKGSGSASTVALAYLSHDIVRSTHVGDSIVLLCGQRGRHKMETIAHSPVGYALEAGVLTEEEAFAHEERHLVSNIIGGETMHITLGGSVAVAARDTLLLASDGLTDNLRQAEIIDTIRRGPLVRAAEALASSAAAHMETTGGKPDDMTFILFRRAISR